MSHANSNITDLTAGLYRRQYAKFIKSQKINALSLEAEAWFWRVHAAADDFGNADGEPGLVHAATAGRRRVTVEQVTGWLNEMKTEGLIREYESAGDTYLHIVGFIRKQPAGKNGKRVRHFPESPWDKKEMEGGIRVNPGASSASDSHSDSHSHTDSENKPAAQASAVAASAARAAASHDSQRGASRNPRTPERQDPETSGAPAQDPDCAGAVRRGSTGPTVAIADADDDEALFPVFPTVGGRRSQARTWRLTDAFMAKLSAAFPGVDVPAQCREAHLWCEVNRTKRKTPNGMEEFLRKWMAKEQNKGGSRSNGFGNHYHKPLRGEDELSRLDAALRDA